MNIHFDRKPFYPTRHSHKHYNRNVYTGQDKAKQNYVNTKIIPPKKIRKEESQNLRPNLIISKILLYATAVKYCE